MGRSELHRKNTNTGQKSVKIYRRYRMAIHLQFQFSLSGEIPTPKLK